MINETGKIWGLKKVVAYTCEYTNEKKYYFSNSEITTRKISNLVIQDWRGELDLRGGREIIIKEQDRVFDNV